MSSPVANEYFEFLADLGMTKHYGSLEATRKLVHALSGLEAAAFPWLFTTAWSVLALAGSYAPPCSE